MPETSTFSALIDEALRRSQRKDRIADVVSYARSSLRECQVQAYFEQDMIEDSITVDAVPFVWARPINLRTILAAKPNSVTTARGEQKYFKNLPPGQSRRTADYFLYLSGNSYIFSGLHLEAGQVIDVAYMTYSRRFIYYDVADRPATFDPETQLWTYSAAYSATEELQEQARDLVTNWVIEHWYDMILEGTLAKLYKTVGDERNRTAFSLYKSMQKDLLKGERVVYLHGNHDTNG